MHLIAVSGRLWVGEQRAADLIHAAGTGASQTLLSMPVQHRDQGLADAMFVAVLGHILVEAGERPPDSLAAALVAVRASAPDLDVLIGGERQLLCEWLDRVIAPR